MGIVSEVMEMAGEGLGLEGGSNHTTPLQPFIWPPPPQPFSDPQVLGAPLIVQKIFQAVHHVSNFFCEFIVLTQLGACKIRHMQVVYCTAPGELLMTAT